MCRVALPMSLPSRMTKNLYVHMLDCWIPKYMSFWKLRLFKWLTANLFDPLICVFLALHQERHQTELALDEKLVH